MKRITEFLKMICVIISLLVLVLMSGCKTTKTVTDKQEIHNTEQEDVFSVEQGGVGESLDRQTVTQWIAEWYAMQQQQDVQQDTEQIQETITTTTDSTGAVTKTEQRTIDRSTSSQSTHSAFDWGKEYKYTIDSLSSRIEALELKISAMSSQVENESEIKQTEKESKSLFTFPTWATWLIVAGLCLVAIYFVRKTFPQ